MKCYFLVVGFVLVLVFLFVFVYDFFFIVVDYDVCVISVIEIEFFNGIFDKSENVIVRDCMVDVMFVDGFGKKYQIFVVSWCDDGFKVIVSLQSGLEGMVVFGVLMKVWFIEMDVEVFNDYFVYDGVFDIFEECKKVGIDDQLV